MIAFAQKRTEIRVETFKDPLSIAPEASAVIGHGKDGETTVTWIDLGRDKWRDRPRRRRGTINVTTLER